MVSVVASNAWDRSPFSIFLVLDLVCLAILNVDGSNEKVLYITRMCSAGAFHNQNKGVLEMFSK
jgi:hypothetical protein